MVITDTTTEKGKIIIPNVYLSKITTFDWKLLALDFINMVTFFERLKEP